MAAPKERFSPDNSSGDQPSKKRPGSPERRGGSSTDFEEVQHEKLLEMGLSFRRIVERTSEYAIFALDREGHVASWNDGAEKRSEEHTSELQSRFDLVCRLLLEKKKEQKRNRLISNNFSTL